MRCDVTFERGACISLHPILSLAKMLEVSSSHVNQYLT
jgi:hypothetical protein